MKKILSVLLLFYVTSCKVKISYRIDVDVDKIKTDTVYIDTLNRKKLWENL